MSHDAPPRSVPAAVDRYRTARGRFYAYRREADVVRLTGLALGFAALTGIAAQIRIPLPFTPVPITLQTFAVLLAGVVLGARFGGLSQTLYIGLGLGGVPWFQGGGAGMGHVLGPTGGYIVGFVAAAAVVGFVIDRSARARRVPYLLAVLFVANFAVIYGIGLPWLYAWLTVVQGPGVTLQELLTMGLLPFVPGDLVKLLGATAVGTLIAPAEPPVPDAAAD